MNRVFDSLDGLRARIAIPDPWQQQAIRALTSGRDAIVNAPTGAGKTFVFESLIRAHALGTGQQAVYTVPTRALANDKWREWRAAGWKVGIATGDLAENLDAPVLVATLETQRERLLAGLGPRLLVIDEYQMIADERRGINYELAVALAPPDTQLLLLSGSVANPHEVGDWLRRLDRLAEVIETTHRPVPLDDIPIGALPDQAPRKVRNFWQRLALGALLSDFGPLLIFAPQRRAAEKIARTISEALPDSDPIELDHHPDLRRAAGPELTRILRKRVAWHHSGLSFAQRTAIVEPLAKAGQLRVIVATFGLAAGINFSVRSVFVGDTSYQDGPYQREVRPDELLQMFGRAGRRGLDEAGYVISADRGPRLIDAHARPLRRADEIDWPTLLRIMHLAAQRGASPFAAARNFGNRLFSGEAIRVGFTGGGRESSVVRPGRGLFGLGPTRTEIRNSAGEWEPERPGARAETSLGMAWLGGAPALSVVKFVAELIPAGARLCRLDTALSGIEKRYGAEMAVAVRVTGEEDRYQLTKQVCKWSRWPKDAGTLTRELIEGLLPAILEPHLGGAKLAGFALRGTNLVVLSDFSDTPSIVIMDSLGRALLDPERRVIAVESETHYADEVTGEMQGSASGSAARAWRQLGLIDERGTPTRRGTVFSFFQHGEGLAIAAALEDESYPIEELVRHLANLRASHRFEAADSGSGGGSERLAIACRHAYGPVDHDGFLRLGLPIGYGEGAAEAVDIWLEGGVSALRRVSTGDREIGLGDVERAFVEWLSLLRHVRAAPDLDDTRWRALQAAANEELSRRRVESPLKNLPAFPQTVLSRHPQHRLSYRSIQTVTN